MIDLDNKNLLLNLEQQVLKNQKDIESLKAMGMPGIKITDVVDELPENPEIGAIYLVNGELYIYTDDWHDIGPFPMQGPQGIAGNPGPKGETGTSTRWYTGINFPPAGIKEGDMFLNTSTYQVYIRSGGQWVSQTNIKGAPGRDGLNGNSIQYIEPRRGVDKTVVAIKTTYDPTEIRFDVPDGKPGAGFHIADTITYPTPLPDDIIDILTEDYPPAQRDYSEAILVKCVYLDNGQTVQKSYVFVIVDDDQTHEKKWDNAGQIEGIEGPAGEPGDKIVTSVMITKTNTQTENEYQLVINNLPYLTAAPLINNSAGEGYFKVVMLPKSVEAATKSAGLKEGYVYLFYEDPPTP